MSLVKKVLMTFFLSVILFILSTSVWSVSYKTGTGTYGTAPTRVVSSGIKTPAPSSDDASTQTETLNDSSYSNETAAVYTGKKFTKEEIEKMGYEVKTREEPNTEVIPDKAEGIIVEEKEEAAGNQVAAETVKSEGFMERFLSFIIRTRNTGIGSENEAAIAAEEEENAPVTENKLGENEAEPQEKKTMQKEEVKEEKSFIAKFFGLFFR